VSVEAVSMICFKAVITSAFAISVLLGMAQAKDKPLKKSAVTCGSSENRR
jgi:hypothetical protein